MCLLTEGRRGLAGLDGVEGIKGIEDRKKIGKETDRERQGLWRKHLRD